MLYLIIFLKRFRNNYLFGYNKTNNTIICEIKKETNETALTDIKPPQFIPNQ